MKKKHTEKQNKKRHFLQTIKKIVLSKKTRKRFLTFLLVFLITYSILLFTNVLWIGTPDERKYPVRGIEISQNQSNVDKQLSLASTNIQFAFIQATTGTSTIDQNFDSNWSNLAQTTCLISAYHTYLFNQNGEEQAENYINYVPYCRGNLPPVVYLSTDATSDNIPSDKSSFCTEFKNYLDIIEKNYKAKPIIYSSFDFYNSYLKDDFTDYPLWIKSTHFNPSVIPSFDFTFWQYAENETLDFDSNTQNNSNLEKNNDLFNFSIYNGSLDSLKKLCLTD